MYGKNDYQNEYKQGVQINAAETKHREVSFMKGKHIRQCVTSFSLSTAMFLAICAANGIDVHAAVSQTDVPANTDISSVVTPDNLQATYYLDGIVQDIVSGQTSSTGSSIYYTNAKGSYSSFTNRGEENFRTALFVDETGVNNDKSVSEVLNSDSAVSDSEASGIDLNTTDDAFSGLLLVGENSESPVSYTLKDSTLNMDSANTDDTLSDFSAYGAAIAAFANTDLTLNNVTVHTSGVEKSALIADQGADVYITDSDLYAAGGDLTDDYVNSAIQSEMCAPPWVLGISGNARTINMLGDYPALTVVDSSIGSNGWATISTDACTQPTMAVIDSDLYQDGTTGYITYAIGNADEYFYGTTLEATTYANIITGGYVTYESSNGEIPTYQYDADGNKNTIHTTVGDGNNCVINSENFGVMFHGSGAANILDGTVMNTENAAFLIRGVGDVALNVDNSEINVTDGTLIQLYDNDDSLVGVSSMGTGGPIFNTTYSEEEGYPGIDYDYTSDDDSSGDADSSDSSANAKVDTANFTNCSLDGNIYNGTGYFADGVTLDLTLGEGADLNGAISATSTMHSTDGGQTQNSSFTIDQYYLLSHVSNKPYYNEANDINVSLEDGANWTVANTSILASLSISDDSTVDGVAYEYEGYDDGVIALGDKLELASGFSYEGPIVLIPDDTEIIDDGSGNLTINIDNSVTNNDNSTTNNDNSTTNNDNSTTNNDNSTTNNDNSTTNNDNSTTNNTTNNITNNTTTTTTTTSGTTTSTSSSSSTSPTTGDQGPVAATALLGLSGLAAVFARKKRFS